MSNLLNPHKLMCYQIDILFRSESIILDKHVHMFLHHGRGISFTVDAYDITDIIVGSKTRKCQQSSLGTKMSLPSYSLSSRKFSSMVKFYLWSNVPKTQNQNSLWTKQSKTMRKRKIEQKKIVMLQKNYGKHRISKINFHRY